MNLTAPPPSNKRVAATQAAVVIHQFFLEILNSGWGILFHLFSGLLELRLIVVIERTSIACSFAEFRRISILPGCLHNERPFAAPKIQTSLPSSKTGHTRNSSENRRLSSTLAPHASSSGTTFALVRSGSVRVSWRPS